MKHLVLTATLFMVLAHPAYAIKKCKDPEGNWHYGDTAEEACATSKVTTLNDRGVVTDRQEAPKTAEELAEEERVRSEQDATSQRVAVAEEERRRILNIYETEDDIDRQRDNQLDSVQGNIDVHKAYLNNMNQRVQRYQQKLTQAETDSDKQALNDLIVDAGKRIETSKAELVALQEQKQRIKDKFAKERNLYLSYKAGLPTIIPED